MDAVQEMLLRSTRGVVAVFPAAPSAWRDVQFRDLRAEGGWRVSAERRGGMTSGIRVTSRSGGVLRLRDPFDGAPAHWSRQVRREGNAYVVRLTAGEMLVGRIDDRR